MNEYELYLGIDPGLEGGVVSLWRSGLVNKVKKTPLIKTEKKSEYDILGMCDTLAEFAGFRTFVSIEKVGAAPGQGVVSMFRFGIGYGIWLGLITALGFPYKEVTPQAWKREFLTGLPKEKESSIIAAQQLFPTELKQMKKPRGSYDHNLTDALLIAAWGRLNY